MSAAKRIVPVMRNFCALRLLLKDSPPLPKTGDKPVPGACNKITTIKRTAITICTIERIISTIIYVLLREMQVFANYGKEEMRYRRGRLQQG